MKVSVVIPNFNHARFLPSRIESVLNQTFQDFDLLILDDASTDDSRAVIQRYVGGRVRFLPNAQNSGTTFAQWNRGFAETRGDYVWIAESDDEAEPRFLERLVGFLDGHPTAAFAYSQSTLIDEQGVPFGMALQEKEPDGRPTRYARDFLERGTDELRRYLQWQMAPVPNASALVFRRRCVEAVGGADTRYRIAGDLHLYIRLLTVGDAGYVAEALSRYRHHRNSVRRSTARDSTHVLERYRLAAELLPLGGLSPRELTAVQRRLARHWVVASVQNRQSIPLARQREIWAAARPVDPHLARHLAAEFLRHSWASLRRRAAPATPA